MAADSNKSSDRVGAFSISWSGGLQYGSQEYRFDGDGKFSVWRGDTENSDDMTGVGLFELELQKSEVEDAKTAAEILCGKDAQTGGPETTDPPWSFSVTCRDGGHVVTKQGSMRLVPASLREKFFRLTNPFSDRTSAEGKKIIKLDFVTDKVERKDGKFVVSVRFINSGERWVRFRTPDQMPGTTVDGRLGVGSSSKIEKNGERDEKSATWGFALGGQKLLNRSEFPDGFVHLNPGETKTLTFQTVPDEKATKGEYEFSGIAYMHIKCEGLWHGQSDHVDFKPIKTRVIIDRDYPSTPKEREEWEATHRTSMLLQPVGPGETFAEDGLYRAVRLVSGSSYRSLQLKPFKAGDIATTEDVRLHMESASGTELNGPVQWVWEGSAPQLVKPYSSEYVEGTEHVCKPGVPCPRSGRWIERTLTDTWNGRYTYRLSSIVTRERGKSMPPVTGQQDAGVVEWEWVGA
ncbi:hypothetical protein AB4Y32_33015 [Paraburkholderia phymatum]|uniref:Uncharacterized protein n=1 Tax=Paraburkholderia phymatum TaxID=148447 RepID=A0ACC6UAE8_9BURK